MKLMKKISGILLCILLAVSFSLSAFAAEGVTSTAPGAELRKAADALDLGNRAEACTDAMRELHGKGVQLFDTCALISDEDKDKLEVILAEVSKATGMDVSIVTAKALSGSKDVAAFTEMLYVEGGFGLGDGKDGTILTIIIGDDRDVYICTHGIATRYLTDRGMDYIYDELNGGVVPALSAGEYAKACAVFAQGVLELYNEGIQQNQVNYNPENGQTDPYYPEEKKGIGLFEVLISALVSAFSGILPVNGVKRKYAMEAEKRLAQGFNQAYKATAAYVITQGDKGQLLTRYTKTIPIPRPQSTGGGRPGGISGHGGGSSHVSSGMGGSMHGGSGRKF